MAGFLLLIMTPSPWFLLVTQLLIVIGNSMANPAIQALASENVAKEEYGETLGIMQSMGSLGRIIGPIMGGWLFGVIHMDAPFGASALILLFIFLYLSKKK